MVLELAITQCTRAPRMMGDHRLEQILPVGGDCRGPVPAYGGEEFLLILEIGGRKHATLLSQPLDLDAVVPGAVVRPSRRVGPAELKQDVLHELPGEIL